MRQPHVAIKLSYSGRLISVPTKNLHLWSGTVNLGTADGKFSPISFLEVDKFGITHLEPGSK